jgi:hypothetical protein
MEIGLCWGDGEHVILVAQLLRTPKSLHCIFPVCCMNYISAEMLQRRRQVK